MPSHTERQRRFIFAKRRQYGTKKDTPKKWKWIWGEEWTELKESRIHGFSEFIEFNYSLQRYRG